MSRRVLRQLLGYCFCLLLCLSRRVAAYSGPSGGKARAYGDAVIIDAAAPIAVTDEDFICATLDWWPPEKCDYGTCSWGLASMLNLVSFPTLKLEIGTVWMS